MRRAKKFLIHPWQRLILLVVVLSGCRAESTSAPDTPADANPDASIPSGYHFLKANSLTTEALEEAREALPYDRIQLERTACYGDCPAYVVTFRRDGSATFVGRSHVKKIGKFSGTISVFDFGKLCWAIEKFKLTELKSDRYVSDTVDHPTTSLRVTVRNTGAQAVIVEDGLPGPVELWVVQNSIDQLTSNVRWKAAQESMLRRQNGDTLISEVARITLVTPSTSALKERIRVEVADATRRTRFMNAIHGLTIEGEGKLMNQAADMRAWDVEILTHDDAGHRQSMGLYWGRKDSGTIVYQSKAYQVSNGLADLRQLIADNSGLPEFGGLHSDGSETE